MSRGSRARCSALLLALVLACNQGAGAGAPVAGGPPVAGLEASGGTSGVGGAGGLAGQGGEGGLGGEPAGAGGTTASSLDAGLDASGHDDAGAADAGTIEAGSPEPQELPQALRDLGIVALYPAPGSIGQCPDPMLRVVFSSPPSLGALGRVAIIDDRGAPVAALDMASSTSTETVGGIELSVERAAYVEGNEAVLYPAPRALELGRSYTVHIEPGALSSASGSAVTLNDNTWTFSARAAAPLTRSALTVASDGNGDFCSPQNAIDAASDGATIEIGRGTFHGIIHFSDRAGLTLRGADRKATILAGTNNEDMNGGTAKRALIGIDDSSDLTIERLTIHNRTPQGGSQAEALRMQRCDRCTVRDADIISLQDTLLWSGTVYAKDCYIAGNVDFIWGTGAAYFDHCEIKTIGRKGYTVQARNGAGGYGYVFVDSRMTSEPGITGHWLGRIDASAYPSSHVAYIDCELGPHIDPAGWQVTGFGGGSLRFWEYGSKSPSGAPIDVSDRHSSSRQLTSTEAAQMRDPSVVLGGWTPE